MKKRYLSVVLFILGACSTPKYVLTTNLEDHKGSASLEGQYTQSTHYSAGAGFNGATSTPMYTYHTYTDTKNTSLKPLLIPLKSIENEGFNQLNAFVHLLNKRKFIDAQKLLEAHTFKNEEIELYLESLFLFMKNKNKESLEKIKAIKPTHLSLYVELLRLDIEYELKKGLELNKNYFIQKYQEIIDSYELDPVQLDLIKTRIKSLRYS